MKNTVRFRWMIQHMSDSNIIGEYLYSVEIKLSLYEFLFYRYKHIKLWEQTLLFRKRLIVLPYLATKVHV